jgi:hypothetical protein
MRTLLRSCRFALLLVPALVAGAATAQAQALYWLDTNYGAPTLNTSDANGFVVSSVSLTPGTLPEGLAVEPDGALYFTESAWTNARVNRGAINLSQIMPIVTGRSALRGIAVDPVSQLIYWISSNLATGASIYRSTTTGGSPTLLLMLPAANPRGLAIDHAGGKIYWTDFDQNVIYRANLDGTGMVLWLPTGPGPYGIAVDPGGQMVYWTEYNSGSIRRAPTTGGGALLVEPGLVDPTYLALDPGGGHIYWADGDGTGQRLNRANLIGGATTILPPALATYGGLAFLSNTTAEVPEATLPAQFALRLWPIPAGGEVHVAFDLPRSSAIRLRVFDLQGREIANLADESLPPGRYERAWDGDSRGRRVAAGVYLIRMDVEGRSLNRRVVITR